MTFFNHPNCELYFTLSRDLRETIFETFMECKRTEILLNVLKFTSPYWGLRWAMVIELFLIHGKSP